MSFYRNAVFLAKGLREFCQSGYVSASKNFRPGDLEVDVSNEAFMITGANSGIGYSTALAIAQKGGTIHMVCRNKERGERAQQTIIEKSGNENVHLHLVDLSDSRGVYQFAKGFVDEEKQLNVLVNNAGVMINTREENEDGHEMNFATNTLGTFILTDTLIPLLSRNENSRVITVSSGGMYTMRLDLKNLQSDRGAFDGTFSYAHQKISFLSGMYTMRLDLNNLSSDRGAFDGTYSYAHQKRQQVIMTEQWAKTHPEIKFYSMHPGWADTPTLKESMSGFYDTMKSRLRQPEAGADTVIWLAVAKCALDEKNGQFYLDRKAQSQHLTLARTRSTEEEHRKLMEMLDGMAAKYRDQK